MTIILQMDCAGCRSILQRLVWTSVSALLFAASAFTTYAFAAGLEVLAVDQKNQPIAGARIELRSGGSVRYAVNTAGDGRARLVDIAPDHYDLFVVKEGFENLRKEAVDLSSPSPVLFELTLTPSITRQDRVEVKDSASPLDQETSTPASVVPQAAKELPGRPATVADVLPLVPGVIRQPGGGLTISAAGEHRSAMVVNSTDVTDPATGKFGLTVPIDVVESLNVYQTPFLAEYGKFTGGLVSVQTRRGGEKWKWEINDPFPEFFIRSYRLRGLRDATPRLNFEGPLVAGKLYLSQGVDYEIRKTPVYELPFPYNRKKQAGLNSFTQLDWIASEKQLVTATLHVAPQRLDFVSLDYFNPQPTTPQATTQNYTAAVADKLTILGGLLENTFSVTRFNANVWPQGGQNLTITPQGNSGNYFEQQTREATRIGWSATFSTRTFDWMGTHSFKAGTALARSSDNGRITEHPINLLNAGGQLLERIDFTPGQPFNRDDLEAAIFGQDHWLLSPKVAVDLGIRTESQEVSESFRVAPRGGIAWTPAVRTGTVIRAGFGLFYDRVPLNVYSWDRYPSQIVSLFQNGLSLGGPFVYENGLGTSQTKFPFVLREATAGNFSPNSRTASIQVEQPVTSRLKLRVGFLESQSSGLILMNRVAPDPSTGVGANLLTGNGQARYHQFEVTARVNLGEKRQLFLSYVRSHARGDLNDFANFLGTFPTPLLRNNQFGNLPADIPNRFLAWGMIPLPWKFRIAPMVELRNGYAYATTDASQNWTGIPYANRFPLFFSADTRISKDFRVSGKYSVRFSVSAYNLTNHFNPEAVHANSADPASGLFFGHRGRRFTADFDVLF